MSADKWRNRYEQQKLANNLMSERLRDERKAARDKEGRMLQYISQLRDDNKTMLSDTLVMKAVLQENGIADPTAEEEAGE